ncbi:MAG: AI-2E family transporter, partial [Capnocytophaga felis]|nr:AI-2E family transporter [Capnocytophaga felis]
MNSKMIANGILRAVVTIVLTILLLYVLYLIRSIIVYIVLALVVALIAKPLVYFLAKKMKIRNKTVRILITMGVFIILSLGTFSLFVPLLISQGKNLSELNIDLLRENLDGLMSQLFDNLGMNKENYTMSASEVLNFIDIPNFLNSFVSFIGSFGAGVFSVLFISFFFIKDGSKMFGSILTLVSAKNAQRTRVSVLKINHLLSRYFLGLVLQLTILFVIYTITLLIFGVQNALIIAFLCAFLNVIPYIGPIIGFVLMTLLTMSSNISSDFMSVTLPTTIYVLIGFFIGQFIDNVFSQPLIFSNSVKSTPLEIFLVILITGTLLGIMGMVIAVPAYTVIKVVLKEFFPNNELVKLMT